MQIRFWGVRGSYSIPPRSVQRFGGNTPCVEISHANDPTIILDAGTGLGNLERTLAHRAPSDASAHFHLLLSHTHWDHLRGLPYFQPLFSDDATFHIYALRRAQTLDQLLQQPALRPLLPSLDRWAAKINYHHLIDGDRFQIGSVGVSCALLNHPSSALGYRLETPAGVVAYVSDTGPFDQFLHGDSFLTQDDVRRNVLSAADAKTLQKIRQGVIELCRDATVIIYDTMFEIGEYRQSPHWGHSTPEHALEIIEEARGKVLVLFHHHPQRSDAQQQAIVDRFQGAAEYEVIAAQEGSIIEIENSTVKEVVPCA